MSASNILTISRGALMLNTAADDRITVGSRLQSDTLPAIVLEHASAERAAIGTGSTSIVRHTMRLVAVSDAVIDSADLASTSAALVISALSALGHKAYKISEPIEDQVESGEGQEQIPASTSVLIECLYKE